MTARPGPGTLAPTREQTREQTRERGSIVGGPVIRDAVLGDAEAMAAAHLRSWQAAYRGILPAEGLDALDPTEWTARYREGLAAPPRPGLHRLVALDEDDRVAALAYCGPAEEPLDDVTGQLYMIYAHPDAWGRGHGHALIEEVHRRLAADGHAAALLWVAAANDRTIGWYTAHGWHLDGATDREDVHGIIVDVARMVRVLAG